MKPTILYVSAHTTALSPGGPRLRAKNSVLALKAVSNVVIEPLNMQNFQKNDGLWPPLEAIRKFHILFNQPGAKDQARHIGKTILEKRPDLIWFSFASESVKIIKHLKRMRLNIDLVADTDTVHWLFLQRAASSQIGLRKAGYTLLSILRRREELWLLKNCAAVTAVSGYDASIFREMSSIGNVGEFGNVVATDEEFEIDQHEYESSDVVIIGSFGGPESAMTQGTKWFLQEVWPLVMKSLPSARLNVVGRGVSTAFSEPYENVGFYSDVPTTAPYFLGAKVSACPLFFESGTRFKILEASIHRIPTVTTSLGLEGLEFEHSNSVMIADSSVNFAEAILGLLANPSLRNRIGSAARAIVDERYSIDAATAQARKILSSVGVNA